MREAVDEYNRVGPYWFVSRYEGCLQEATIQNLHDYFAVFAAKAWILKEPREELVKYLECRASTAGTVSTSTTSSALWRRSSIPQN